MRPDILIELTKHQDVYSAVMNNAVLVARDIAKNYIPRTLEIQDYIDKLQLKDLKKIKITNESEHIDFTKKKLYSLKDKLIGALDGGLGAGTIGTTTPFIMRSVTYSVKIGDHSREREMIDPVFFLLNRLTMGALNSSKDLLGAILLLFELNSVHESLKKRNYDYFFVHGPLVRSLGQYTDYELSQKDLKQILGDNFEDFKRWVDEQEIDWPNINGSSSKLSYISAVLYTINKIFDLAKRKKILICGVVERTDSTEIVQRELVANVKVFNKDFGEWFKRVTGKQLDPESSIIANGKKIKIFLDNLGYSDKLILGKSLNFGEFIKFRVTRANKSQSSNHMLGLDIGFIGKYDIFADLIPETEMTYIRTSDTNEPFRVEVPCFLTDSEKRDLMETVFAFSQFLPKYAFPVNLDIVDKMAKVSGWLTRAYIYDIKKEILEATIFENNFEKLNNLPRLMKDIQREWYLRPR